MSKVNLAHFLKKTLPLLQGGCKSVDDLKVRVKAHIGDDELVDEKGLAVDPESLTFTVVGDDDDLALKTKKGGKKAAVIDDEDDEENDAEVQKRIDTAVRKAMKSHKRNDDNDDDSNLDDDDDDNGRTKRFRVTGGQPRMLDDPKRGFKHVGEFAHSVQKHFSQKGQKDERLTLIHKASLSTFGSELSGADGGFLIPPDFNETLLKHTFDDNALLQRTNAFTTASNNLTIPKDETTPWGSAGVQAFWTGESTAATQTKPVLGEDQVILHKLTVLVPVTDEMASDTFIGLGTYIDQMASERIRFKTNEAIVNGTGSGQPLGFALSPALVVQAKSSGQAASTINLTNIATMLSRIPSESMSNMLWLIHPSAFPQLVLLTNGNQSLWIPAGGVQGVGYNGTLFGIPTVISQHCKGLTAQGDIYLVDLSRYITLTKGTGIESAMSIHLFFDQGVSAFRFSFRVAGQPWLDKPIKSQYQVGGSDFNMSPFVTLQNR